LREAGDRASSLNAYAQAERYYREALALASQNKSERIDLLFRLGRVRYVSGYTGVEELTVARDGLLAAGNREGAAEAALMLADISWSVGSRENMLAHLDDARSLVAGEPPSRVQASVLSEVSRYDMLADRNESALEVGLEALRMAEELGLDDLRAHALNNIGCARVGLGDARGIEDLEQSIAQASRLNSGADLIRGHNNVATLHLMLGNLDAARASVEESIRLAEHFGHTGFLRFSEGGPNLGDPYQKGRWDEALAGAEAFLADVADGAAHYQAGTAYGFRGLIRLGRADDAGAESDAQHALESARPAKDPQVLQAALAMAALIFVSIGSEIRAREILEEALADLRELNQMGFAVIWSHALAWVAWTQGRRDAFLEAVSSEPLESPWIRAARAIAVGDFREAAEIFEQVDAVTTAAFYRLRSAEQLVAEGRRAEADEQLNRALAFYRSVGATRYVREGEALLAATA
jgi:tetratricopeptide (TPR) repeat protein